MQIDVDGITYDGEWCDHPDYEGVRLKIRPYPLSKGIFTAKSDGTIVVSGEDRVKIYLYSFMDHEGIVDANGKQLVLSEEVKQKMFDFNLGGLNEFVLEKSRVFHLTKVDSEKKS